MTTRKLSLFVALFAFLAIGLFAFPGHAAAATCAWNGTTGNWSDSSKWSCAAVPGSGDIAQISSGTVTLTANVTVQELDLTGGTLTGGFDIDVTTTLNWSGGTMSGTGTAILDTTGTWNASGTGTFYLDTRTFENDGTINFNKSGGYLYMSNNAIFNNMSGANFNVQNASTYVIYGNTGVFNNLAGATFTKSSSGETSITNLSSFNNAGTLTLSGSNILHLDPTGTSTDTGPFTISVAGATLDFAGGIHNLNTGANITGSGSVDFSYGTVYINSTYNLSGGTTVSGGTVSFSSSATLTSLGGSLTVSNGSIDLSSGESLSVASLTQSAGTLTGSDTLTVNTSLNWTGGTESGTGITNLTASTTWNFTGTGTPYLDTRTFNNAGTVNFNKSGGYLYLTNNAIFNNTSGANFNVQNASTYTIYGNTGVFNNLAGATFTKSSSGETSITNLSSFNNAGTLTLSGSNILHLDPTGTSTDTGPFTISVAGATLDFAGGIHNLNTGADITGSGSVDFSYGTVYINSTYNLSGGTTVSGATVSFSSSATLTSLGGSLTVSNGSIDLSSGESLSVASLTQSAGTLTGSDTLTVNTSLNWTGGTESGTGITNLAAAGTLATTGTGTPYLDTRTFNNAGTVNFNKSGGYLYLTNNAIFNNMSGANFNVQNASTYAIYGNTGVFNNLAGATFTKASSGDTSIISITSFNNTGTLTLTGAGVLHLDPTGTSTDTGPFTISVASATLDFAGGIHNLNAGANITGSGSVDFSYGTVYINSTYNLSGGTTVSGGTVSFPSSATLTSLGGSLTVSNGSIDISSGENPSMSSLTQSGGTITGSDAITVTTTLNWSGGTMSGYGVTNLAASGTMATTGSSSMTLDTRTFNNAGTVNWNSSGYLYMATNAIFNNKSGANFNVQTAGTYVIYGSTGVFNNQAGATFTKTSSGDTGIYYLTSFNNAGTLTLAAAGVLLLSPSGTSTATGPFNINDPGATLDFGGGTHNINAGANFSGSGTVDFSGGTEYIHSVYNISGGTTASGGTVSFAANATLTSLGSLLTISGGSIDLSSGEKPNVASLNESNGTLTGGDTITVTTNLNWGGGTMAGTGVTNLAATGTMVTSATGSDTLNGRTFNNAGTINWNSTGYLTLSGNATFKNLSGATFNTLSSGSYVVYGYAGTFINAGTLNLPGSGNFIANVFTQTSTGVINMALSGTLAGTNFCQITGTTSTLNGSLNVTLNGYLPVFGDHFDVLLYTNHSGTFSVISLPTVGSGLTWGSTYQTDRLRLNLMLGIFLPLTIRS